MIVTSSVSATQPALFFDKLRNGEMFMVRDIDEIYIKVALGLYVPITAPKTPSRSFTNNFPKNPPVLRVTALHATLSEV